MRMLLIHGIVWVLPNLLFFTLILNASRDGPLLERYGRFGRLQVQRAALGSQPPRDRF